MSKSGNSLREAMTALSREELRGAEHPSTSRLIAYQRDQTPPVETAAIREHLSLCAQCTAVVLDAGDFFTEAGDEEEAAPAADLEASWQKIQAARRTADQGQPSPAPLPVSRFSPRGSLVRSLAFAYALAASFAAISAGLLLFKSKEMSQLPRPQANVRLYDLKSADSERGESTDVTAMRFRFPADSALLVLNPAAVARSARYGVRIRSADGAEAWRSEDLVPQASGGFHLSLPAGALPPGRYSVELYGTTAGRETPLGTYPIAIEN